jgi:hypothetical protein
MIDFLPIALFLIALAATFARIVATSTWLGRWGW